MACSAGGASVASSVTFDWQLQLALSMYTASLEIQLSPHAVPAREGQARHPKTTGKAIQKLLPPCACLPEAEDAEARTTGRRLKH